MNVNIYTDGSCEPNPGYGGWASLLLAEGYQFESFGHESSKTTNNRMELTAILEGMKQLRYFAVEHDVYSVTVYSDSKYCIESLNQWVDKWQRNEWRTSNNKPVKNQDLFEAILKIAKDYKITWKWVKGHNGDVNNEYVDNLAECARTNKLTQPSDWT